MNQFVNGLTTTATAIGFVVIFAWIVMSVWIISVVIGEFRFNRMLKRREEQDFEDLRSSWLQELREQNHHEHDGVEYRLNTVELPINFRFHPREDDIPTEETGAVFDISERFPNEFA